MLQLTMASPSKVMLVTRFRTWFPGILIYEVKLLSEGTGGISKGQLWKYLRTSRKSQFKGMSKKQSTQVSIYLERILVHNSYLYILPQAKCYLSLTKHEIACCCLLRRKLLMLWRSSLFCRKKRFFDTTVIKEIFVVINLPATCSWGPWPLLTSD